MDTLIPNDQLAPDFTLEDLDGTLHSLGDYRGQIVVVNFWSAECPWARRIDERIAEHLNSWGEAVNLFNVASNANEPVDMLTSVAVERRYSPSQIWLDPRNKVADLYGAETTPHFFVIDRDGVLRYRGAFDDTTFRQRTPTQSFLLEAVGALLGGTAPTRSSTPPYGCAIVRHST